MPKRPATIRDLRRASRATVLRELWFDGPLSRQDVSARTTVSTATVSNVVSELLSEGVVAEVGQVASDGGRPAVLVGVRPAFGSVVGIDVSESGVVVELFDLSLGWSATIERSLGHRAPDPQEILALAAAATADVLAKAGKTAADVLGIGVGVPGLVEDDAESVVHAPSLGWQAVPFATLLEQATGIPVALDNGAKALARAEAWFGAGNGAQNLIVCLIGSGVGAAILADGRLFRGATGSAGEWGHTTAVIDGRPCRCGARGCLQAYVGAEAILERWAEAAGAPIAEGVSEEQAIEALLAEAHAGPGPAREVLDETAHYLGVALADIINLLNPDRVVLGGWVGLRLGPELLPRIRAHAQKASLAAPFARVELDLCHLGPDAVARGAATLVVERFLSSGGTPMTIDPAVRAAGGVTGVTG
ncbi:MAG TPA: ROK family transcriptional regulator [Baekduia sp.]|nr:ROK family transcriptional regulator [Baekduia sp.]